MGKTINLNETGNIYNVNTAEIAGNETGLIEIAEGILFDTHDIIIKGTSISMPIAELATLGAGVTSLIPALRTITQTTTVNTEGLYRLANAEVGDALKAAKNRNFWGAFKTAEGKSKLAQLQAADTISTTNTTNMPINPATMMMAVALFSIEQQLGNIMEMEKQILSFLEIEKESEIEADVETLSNIISKYKSNWDNEHFISGNHKIVLDIQRTARKHMNSYCKKVTAALNSKQLFIAQAKVNSLLKDLQKKFRYYRFSLYTFSLASFIEIMLSGNFREENIMENKLEMEACSLNYRNLFTQCSIYLEKMTGISIETNVLKGIGAASKTVGKFIGSIPIVKKSSVDELLQDGGTHLQESAQGLEKDVIESFAEISNPGTGIFMEKMNDMIQIYNHTSEICFDAQNIYLITE